MSKNKVIVLSVLQAGLSVAEAARRYGVGRQWVHTLLARYRAEGEAGLEPRSRKPRSNPSRTAEPLRARALELREELLTLGMDAGPVTIAWHLENEGLRPPSPATIHRILHDAGLITPEPRKRPKSSYRRFEAAQPNETWQSDFTHWALADGTDTEIISWLDDHSRYLLHTTAHPRITGDIVVDTVLSTINTYGLPASTLTDNGMVYTTRLAGGRGGRNRFETLIASLGITQKNGSPYHPQTQGKIERYHQTLKRWLSAQSPAQDLPELNTHLLRFARIYNTERPHRALNRQTPASAYTATDKAVPATARHGAHYRIRQDTVDGTGKVSLRYAGKLRHLGIGRTHKGTRVTLIIHDENVMALAETTGETLAEFTLDPTRGYQPRKRQNPQPED